MKIGVFCGSNNNVPKFYSQAALEVGRFLAEINFTIVYGGVESGLMGNVANSSIANQGKVIGVSPVIFENEGILHKNLTELLIVESMHERKSKIYEICDLFLILPGGFGTYEELFESLTWNQIGLHDKRIIIYNIKGFYNHLIDHINHALKEGFITQESRRSFTIINSLEEFQNTLTY